MALVLASTARLVAAGTCGSYFSLVAVASPMPRDGVVLLELLGDRDAIAEALPHAHFVTADGDVPARVVDMLEGGHLQVVLAPTRTLPAGQVVHLALGIDEVDAELQASPVSVGDETSSTPPSWRHAPSPDHWIDIASNKGDGTHAMRVNVPLAGPAWVLATISTADRTARAIYRVDDNAIAIGHTGCHSMYSIALGGPARVALTAIGASGLHVPAPGPPLKIAF